MKTINLTQGKVTLVDDWNYDWLNEWKWYAWKHRNTYYAVRNISRDDGMQAKEWMHRVIMQTPKEKLTDHQDRNGLNNQEYNLRPATNSQNQYNKKGWGKSKYKGVCLRKDGYIISKININHKRIHLGYFKTEELAARAYDIKAQEYFGEFANLNFPKS
jgi:hypothetical protein